jgi:hypothetical protein
MRFERRSSRLDRERRAHVERMAAKAARMRDELLADGEAEARKRAIVAQALARARAQLAARARQP